MSNIEVYFPHEATASNDQRLIKLIETLGMQGYGAYWILLEHLRLQANYVSTLHSVSYLARQIKVTKPMLMRVIKEFDLFTIEEDSFYSEQLIRRMEPLEDKRKSMIEQRKRAAAAKWQKYYSDKQVEKDATVDADAEGQLMLPQMLSKEKKSKAEESKESINSPSLPPRGMVSTSFWDNYTPPPHVLNKQTHNYEGVVFQLNQLHIDDPTQIRSILTLSEHGKLGSPFWKVMHKRSIAEWLVLKNPGIAIIRALKKIVVAIRG